ncbi:hypothetical protein H0H87_009609 [Tephrocybe sp. NHM501043]|nr:hypothetical protein H0H87_009609 [Tephrocybe sp. NHM501043]
MASWNSSALISTHLTLDDISLASSSSYFPEFDGQVVTPILKLITEARSKGYDALALPLTTEKWKMRWEDMCLLPPGVDREIEISKEQKAEVWRSRPGFLEGEVTLTRLDEAEGVTVMISDWLELDAIDDWVRHDAEIALQQELSYASYLNVQSAILPAPRNREHVASYARIVNSCLKNTPYIHLSIRLPIYDPSVLHYTSPSSSDPFLSTDAGLSPIKSPPKVVVSGSSEKLSTAPESELNATWEMWDLIRSICEYNTRLTLTLDLSPPLPSTIGVLSKWAAESVRNILLPASTFIANGKGYPVLPKTTQSFIRECMIHYPNVILSGVNAGIHNRGGEAAYKQYTRHLEKTSPAVQAAERAGTVENFAQGYQDYLQAPLQPLMDNLQSVTYQTFEQDPVKYRQYEEAMYRALIEWQGEEPIVFCVAGAGRGPLVARCLTAIERSRRSATIYAVEKNPNAYVTLQDRKTREWGDKVQLVFGDMRFIDVPEPADILVSELLGSFGDNELSPECLDGAMRFLKSTGISIPSSYTAHLAPLSSSKLFNEARASKDAKSLETPYVVMFQAVNILSGNGGGLSGKCGPQVQECWEFEHPRTDPVLDARGLPKTNSHNVRSAKLNFYIPHAGVLHGLAGYFEAVLYRNVGLSIHPHRKEQISKDMLSWFPLFFPFKEALYLPSNSELQVSIWRLTNERQVWYEWHAESFLSSPSIQLDSPVAIPASPAAPTLSPLVDADDPTFLQRARYQAPDVSPIYETVKIGQTSLHNPGGRSSWIGL